MEAWASLAKFATYWFSPFLNLFYFLLLLKCRHLGCFHFLAIVNSAAMNLEVNVSFQIIVLSGYMPRSETAGSCGNSISLLSPFDTSFLSIRELFSY